MTTSDLPTLVQHLVAMVDETDRPAVIAHYEHLRDARDAAAVTARNAATAFDDWVRQFLDEDEASKAEALAEAVDARLLPPVWDAEAGGWRCPYPHEGIAGLMAEPTRQLVAIESVDDWREILDSTDPEVDHEHGPVMLVGDSSYGDGSLDSVSCLHCERDVDISAIDLDYV